MSGIASASDALPSADEDRWATGSVTGHPGILARNTPAKIVPKITAPRDTFSLAASFVSLTVAF